MCCDLKAAHYRDWAAELRLRVNALKLPDERDNLLAVLRDVESKASHFGAIAAAGQCIGDEDGS